MFTVFIVVGALGAYLVCYTLTGRGAEERKWIGDKGCVLNAPWVKTTEDAREAARDALCVPYDFAFCSLAQPCSSYSDDFATLMRNSIGFSCRYEARRVLVDYYGWAIPSPEALETIAQFSPLIEIGAGRGYWTWLLRVCGADVLAFDNWARPYSDRVWTEVLQGTPRQIPKHPNRTLLMIWPELGYSTRRYSEDGECTYVNRDVSNVMWKSITKYRGDTILLVAEGWGGCCGTEAAWELLEQRGFKYVRGVSIPQWDGIHDDLQIWRRGIAALRAA
jgi:hypothetical protein